MLALFQTITDLTPWFWWDALQMGGGTLNAGLTHILGMLETITGRQVVKVTGEAHVLCWRAPIVPTLHDYRQRGAATLTPAEAAKLEWRAWDADNAFSALLHFAAATPKTPVVWVYINVSVMAGFNGTDQWLVFLWRPRAVSGRGLALADSLSVQCCYGLA